MKKTKLILTRAAAVLFVMFMAQTVWAQNLGDLRFAVRNAGEPPLQNVYIYPNETNTSFKILYDGTEKTFGFVEIQQYTGMGNGDGWYRYSGENITITYNYSNNINASTEDSPAEITATIVKKNNNGNGNGNTTTTEVKAYFTISKCPIRLVVTGNKVERTYDGTQHSTNESPTNPVNKTLPYTKIATWAESDGSHQSNTSMSESTFNPSEGISYSGEETDYFVTRTDYGTSNQTLDKDKFTLVEKFTKNFELKTVVVRQGFVKINKVNIAITTDSKKEEYNDFGTKAEGYTVTSPEHLLLPHGEELVVDGYPTLYYVDEIDNEPTTVYVKRGEEPSQNEDGESNYEIVVTYGRLKVTPRSITIKAKDQTIKYGESLPAYEIDWSVPAEQYDDDLISVGEAGHLSLCHRDIITEVTLTPSTDEMTTDGKITPSAAKIEKRKVGGELIQDVTNCYNISYEDGNLTIGKGGIVTVKVWGKTREAYYQDKPLFVKGVEKMEVVDNTKYQVEWVAVNEELANATGRYVGRTWMELTPEAFTNTNTEEFEGLNIVIEEDGYLDISYYNAELKNAEDNTAAIHEVVDKYGAKANVKLAGRTLYKDGSWNTICLPFDVDVANSPLADADVREFDLENTAFEPGYLTIEFKPVTTMEAGVPYIVKWAAASENLVDPVFKATNDYGTFSEGTVDVVKDLGEGSITFKGTYAPVEFTEANENIMLVGANNDLYTPKAGAKLNSQRAYFELEGFDGAAAPAFVLNFGGATNINNMNVDKAANVYFDMIGRRVEQPTEKGIYIMNGKKIVVK